MDSVREPLETYLTPFGYKIRKYGSVSSTNDLAKEIARNSIEDHVVVIAETQTHGRGRLEREWISPQGGLWFSVILRPQFSLKEALRLTFIMSSTIAETIRTMFGLETRIMWPNDILVEDRKICGILTEAITNKDSVGFVVIGVGLNANIDLDLFPENLRETVTTLKHELGHEVDLKTLVSSLLQTFEERYKQLVQGLWTSLLEEWKDFASFLGKKVTVTSFDEAFRGKALDVGQDCALLIKLDGGSVKRVIVGDVTVQVQS